MIAIKNIAACALFAGATAVFCSIAQAHVVLGQPSAPVGSAYQAVLRVGHGCSGAATTGITVRLPEGFRGARPQPKPGWTLAVRRAALAEPYESHGRTVREDVVEVTWRAATLEAALDDAFYDEFNLRGSLPAQPGALWFKVLQTCGDSSVDWAEVPAGGESVQNLKTPALLLQVLPADGAQPQAHHH